MRQKQHNLVRLLPKLGLMVFFCLSAPAFSSTVLFQVTYEDGVIRNLPTVPETSKGILRVDRLATISGDMQAAESLSTESPQIRREGFAQTYRSRLKWNGQAWVGNPHMRTEELSSASAHILDTSFGATPEQQAQSILWNIIELENRLAFWNLAAVDIEADMFEYAGTPEAGLSRWDLAGVHIIQKRLAEELDYQRARLQRLEETPPEPQTQPAAKPILPSGTIQTPKPDPAWQRASGIAFAISETRLLPYRVQVWPMPQAVGKRAYKIAMAHPEAGTFGAFYYVAFADTTGDDTPDTMIARSPLATANMAGEWTTWSFTTDHRRVYVGTSCPWPDNAFYYSPTPNHNWRGLPSKVFVSERFGQLPTTLTPGHITNCRIQIIQAISAMSQPATTK